MTDDRAEFIANRDAGLVKRHEQRLARAAKCKCTYPDDPRCPIHGDVSALDHDALAAEVEAWLQECGSCDYALAMGCTCPKGDYRNILLKVWQAYQAQAADTKALVETAAKLGRELGRREAAEELAVRADQLAENYQATAVAHRDLSDRTTTKGVAHGRTASAFRNKADGAWAVAYMVREIATEEPK